MPDEPRCVDLVSDTLRGYQGIDSVRFDVERGQMDLVYDPRRIRDEAAKSLVEHVGRDAAGLVAHCERRSPEECALCVADMRGQIERHFTQRRAAPATTFRDGLMQVSLQPRSLASGEAGTVSRRFGVEPSAAPPRRWTDLLSRGRLEVAFTGVNLLTLLAAAVAARSGVVAWVPAALYAIAFISGGSFGLVDGLAALRRRRIDVNLLMILAALGAATIGQPAEGAVLLFLFSLSNTLQTFALDRNRRAISSLMGLRPAMATVRRGSRLVTMPVEQLVLGDRVLVRPGERIPVDGQVVDGTSEVDQAPITGESVPALKTSGETVFAGTMNGRGSLEVKVTHRAEDSTLAKIVRLVEEARSSRAATQRMIDEFEQVYAILVILGAALLTAVPWLAFGREFQPTFYRAMTWLVVASPCALVISTPASILSAIANGARAGVLFKGGAHLEKMSSVRVVAFDKTGTLTSGKPSLTHIEPQPGVSAEELLAEAASVEARSEHPLAAAVVTAARSRGLDLHTAMDFLASPGLGVEAALDGQAVWIGGERLFYERRVAVPPSLVERVVMLTGDNQRVAGRIAAQAGVDEFHAGLLPEDKAATLKSLRATHGMTAMVGDGVNDAPALATADLGIAMGGAGTDIALETADVVLMSDDLSKLPYAIGLSRSARRVVRQNLAFALSVIVLLIVAAFGATLPLPLGVVGHEGSTVLVVLNGLRLLGFRPSRGPGAARPRPVPAQA